MYFACLTQSIKSSIQSTGNKSLLVAAFNLLKSIQMLKMSAGFGTKIHRKHQSLSLDSMILFKIVLCFSLKVLLLYLLWCGILGANLLCQCDIISVSSSALVYWWHSPGHLQCPLLNGIAATIPVMCLSGCTGIGEKNQNFITYLKLLLTSSSITPCGYLHLWLPTLIF